MRFYCLWGYFSNNPIIVNVYNIGYILLLENKSAPQWKNHIDIFNHLIWDYIKYITLKMKFVRSEENTAYPFTKNLSNGPFHLLTSGYVQRE